MSYARGWRTGWGLVTALGVGVGMLEWSVTTVAVTLALSVLLSWIALWLVHAGGWLRPGAPGLRGIRLPSAMTLGAALVAGWSWSGLTPALGVLLALLAGLSAPATLGILRHAGHRRTPPGPAPRRVEDEAAEEHLTAAECLGPLSGLDDHDLCRLWRQSFWVVSERSTPETVLRVVVLREACLAELERRDPAAVAAWLATGDWRASGGPEKYMTPPRPGTAGTA